MKKNRATAAKPKQAPRKSGAKRRIIKAPKAKPYKATLQVERAGVTIFVDGVSRDHLANVVSHVLGSLKSAGVRPTPDEPVTPIESVGGYAPLDVKDDPFEQGRKPRRVGF